MGKWKKSSEALVAKFLEAVGKLKEIDHRKMFGYPCCFVNGNMFTGLHEENWVVRLSELDREQIDATPFEPMQGRRMREYIILPKEVVADPSELSAMLELSLAYASSLPPKIKK